MKPEIKQETVPFVHVIVGCVMLAVIVIIFHRLFVALFVFLLGVAVVAAGIASVYYVGRGLHRLFTTVEKVKEK